MSAIGSTTTDRLFSVTVRNDEQSTLYKALLSMAGTIIEEDGAGNALSFISSPLRTLFVSGSAGTGKTYLCACAANEFRSKTKRICNKNGFEITELDIARVLAGTELLFFSGRKLRSFLEDLLKCHFLVIDELPDLGKYSRATLQTFNEFMVLRHDSRAKTIVTTELKTERISQMLDQSVRRRLSRRDESRIVTMTGQPYNGNPSQSTQPARY